MPGRYCAVTDCPNSGGRARLDGKMVAYHRFPADPLRRRQWERFARPGGKWSAQHALRLCSDHFAPDEYERDLYNELLDLPRRRKVLKSSAVPSIRPSSHPPQTAEEGERTARWKARERKRLVAEILAAPKMAVEAAAEAAKSTVPACSEADNFPCVGNLVWLSVLDEVMKDPAGRHTFNFVCVQEEEFDYGDASPSSPDVEPAEMGPGGVFEDENVTSNTTVSDVRNCEMPMRDEQCTDAPSSTVASPR